MIKKEIIFYAGIGSREAPAHILDIMTKFGYWAAKEGMILRSGKAKGSDRAFEKGCDILKGKKEIFTVESVDLKDNNVFEIAKKFHPAWHLCKPYHKLLHARNVYQILGKTYYLPVDFVVCWTKDAYGSEHNKVLRTVETGGTGTAIDIAKFYNIPVFNLAQKEDLDFILSWIKEKENKENE